MVKGPVKYNCVYDGEVYDANMEQDGWTEPGFDDSDWKQVSVFTNYEPRLSSHRMPAIKIKEIFSRVRLMRMSEGSEYLTWDRILQDG